jgi:hypothetical protein
LMWPSAQVQSPFSLYLYFLPGTLIPAHGFTIQLCTDDSCIPNYLFLLSLF